MSYHSDDLNLLLPSFKPFMELIIQGMAKLGYTSIPFDTYRTPKEALKYAARGVGQPDSIHCYGGACDCICAKHGWDCIEYKCNFFNDYGKVVESNGMVWGGRFSRHDGPHAQCVTIADQAQFRALPSAQARDAFIATRLCSPALLQLRTA